MLNQLLSRSTLVRVFDKAAGQEIFQQPRVLVIVCDREVGLRPANPIPQQQHGPVSEGKVATAEKTIRQHPKCPDVDFAIVFLALNDLRCHIEWSAYLLTSRLTFFKYCSEAKIGKLADNLSFTLLVIFDIDHHVFHLKVAMNHTFLVHIVQCHQDLMNYIGRVLLCEGPAFLDRLIEHFHQVSMMH